MVDRTLGIAKAREAFSTIVEQVQYRGQSFVISRHGKPAVAVVPIEVYESWKRQRAEFFDRFQQIQSAADLSPEAADRLAVEAVASVRRDARQGQ